MFDSNRRKYPRANYPCHLTLWLADGSRDTVLANTSNIGMGGLCVHLHSHINVSTRVDIQVLFTNPTTPFKCTGVVVRSREDKANYINIGIQFDPLSELKYAFLDGKVAELIELEKKGKA